MTDATSQVVGISQAPKRATRSKSARLQAIARKRYAAGQASTGMPYVSRKHDGRRLAFTTADKRKLATDLRTEWIAKHPREPLAEADVRYVVSWLEGQAERAERDAPTAAEQAAQMAAGGEPDGWTAEDAARAYEVRGGALGWHRPAKDGGTIWTPLATFDAAITEEVVRDDGAEETRVWRVQLTLPGGGGGEAEITPDQLARPQQWAAKAAGSAAVVMPGPMLSDHLRVAVQSRSRPARRTVYCHTGWREIDGCWHYLTTSGALGAAGLDGSVTVDLGPLSGYALPPVRDMRAVRAAVRDSLELLDMAPDKATVVWLAAVYRSPLPLPPDCAGWLYGPSGTFKTQMTALGQQHYGPGMHARALPGSWSSTANALEATSFTLNCALFVVDDYSPDVTQVDARKRAAVADRLVRGSANQAARGRSRPDGTLRPAKPPRAQLLTSAEDVPPGVESMRARTFVTKLAPGDVDLALLTAGQQAAAAGIYATAQAGYIQSLAGRYDASRHFPGDLATARDKYRDAAQAGGHPRCAENIASLALGWHEMLAFAEEIEAISPEERTGYWSRAWKALGEVGSEQESYRRDADPVTIYLTSLRALIAAGRAHVDGRDGGCPPGQPGRWGWVLDTLGSEPVWRSRGDLVGWIDGGDLYFESSVSYEAARRFAEAAGQPLSISKRGLHEHLGERQILASTGSKGKLSARVRLGGTQQTVVHLSLTTFDDGEAS
jgi:hypothetical protein